jgi:transposase-like protein
MGEALNSRYAESKFHFEDPAIPTEKQELVRHFLANGQPVTAAAKAGNVSRDTVYRWLKKDPTFIAALNRARFEQRQVVEAVLTEGAIRAAKFLVSVIENKEAPRGKRCKPRAS